MILEDEPLLETYRGKGKCECCGRECKERDPAHIIPRGLGGGGRVDIPGNLVSLRRWCHAAQGTANGPSLDYLRMLASTREGVSWESIQEAVHAIQRLPKDPTDARIEVTAEVLKGESRKIFQTAMFRWQDQRAKEAKSKPEPAQREEPKKKKKKAKPEWMLSAQKRQKEFRKDIRRRLKAARKVKKWVKIRCEPDVQGDLSYIMQKRTCR